MGDKKRKDALRAPEFPMETFLQVKQEMLEANRALNKEKANWAQVRNSLKDAKRQMLDEQFKLAFEQLGELFLDTPAGDLEPVLQTIKALVEQGASAGLLGNHELGTYNLAMLVKDIPMKSDNAGLDMVTKIIRLTIVAGADLTAQKAYAGNGGAVSLDWLCMYLGRGISDQYYLRNPAQYACCYKIFPWIVATRVEKLNPFNVFLVGLKSCPQVAGLQEKILLAMMGYGFSPCNPDDIYQPVSFFSRVAAVDIKWLTMLFPYEEEPLQSYINAFQQNITAAIARNLINSFTSNNKNRKNFRAFFSVRPHWLLQNIVTTAPDVIFDLVKRNEQDMLIPFLKTCKPAMLDLRDEKGNTLLHQAVLSRGLMENTIQLLRNARFSLQAVNREGLTPLALAVKNNRTELVKWLNYGFL